MIQNQYAKQKQLDQLSEIDPYLVLLFGSQAYGKPHEDRDIVLLAVTKDDFMPENFKEKSDYI